jgi:ribonuclease J
MAKGSNVPMSEPIIHSRGFVYVKESEELMREMQKVLEEAVDNIVDRNISDRNKIRNNLRDAISGYVWRKTKRRPMILSSIIEVD